MSQKKKRSRTPWWKNSTNHAQRQRWHAVAKHSRCIGIHCPARNLQKETPATLKRLSKQAFIPLINCNALYRNHNQCLNPASVRLGRKIGLRVGELKHAARPHPIKKSLNSNGVRRRMMEIRVRNEMENLHPQSKNFYSQSDPLDETPSPNCGILATTARQAQLEASGGEKYLRVQYPSTSCLKGIPVNPAGLGAAGSPSV